MQADNCAAEISERAGADQSRSCLWKAPAIPVAAAPLLLNFAPISHACVAWSCAKSSLPRALQRAIGAREPLAGLSVSVSKPCRARTHTPGRRPRSAIRLLLYPRELSASTALGQIHDRWLGARCSLKRARSRRHCWLTRTRELAATPNAGASRI